MKHEEKPTQQEFSESILGINSDLRNIVNFSDNEATAYPWWVIVNGARGRQMCDPANTIVGPFFSREAAVAQLKARAYDYHKNAYVYCMSGHESGGYRKLLKLAGKS